jgi:hypothetical protein
MVLLFLAGVWLFVAPFLLHYQSRTQHWAIVTRNDLITGAALAAITAIGVLIVTASAARSLYLRAKRARVDQVTIGQESSGWSSGR